MTALSKLLTDRNQAGAALSGRSIARRAGLLGFSLNHDTAARYLRGDHGRPDESTLLAFAAVLDIPLEQLRVAAGLPSEQVAPYTPPPEASRLSRRQRRAVDEIIRSMLEPVIGDEVEPAAAIEASELADDLRAARRGDVEPPPS